MNDTTKEPNVVTVLVEPKSGDWETKTLLACVVHLTDPLIDADTRRRIVRYLYDRWGS